VAGERQLEQDAVDALVLAQIADQGRQLLGRDVPAGLVVKRLDAHLGGVLALHAHVDGRRRVVAHQHRGQAGRHVHPGDLTGHLSTYPRGDRLAVDDPGAHRFLSGA
jgi:hypothetical protein